jgi:hypothetical protein
MTNWTHNKTGERHQLIAQAIDLGGDRKRPGALIHCTKDNPAQLYVTPIAQFEAEYTQTTA